jgi:hypothetical protein
MEQYSNFNFSFENKQNKLEKKYWSKMLELPCIHNHVFFDNISTTTLTKIRYNDVGSEY